MAEERRFEVEGMHCGSCAEKVTEALRGVEGVERARVGLSPPVAEVSLAEGVEFERLQSAVGRAGYRLTRFGEADRNGNVRGAAEDDGSAGGSSAGTARNGSQDESGRARSRAGQQAASHESAEHEATEGSPKESLYPLGLIVAFILGASVLVNLTGAGWSWAAWMADFMGGFFLVFAGFKLLDLRGFVGSYRRYDLIAARLPAWGWSYPFVELGLGAMFLARWAPTVAAVLTIVLMLVGAAGVFIALRSKTKIRCGCLGTALNLPMTTVTLVENLGMAVMAGVMLVM